MVRGRRRDVKGGGDDLVSRSSRSARAAPVFAARSLARWLTAAPNHGSSSRSTHSDEAELPEDRLMQWTSTRLLTKSELDEAALPVAHPSLFSDAVTARPVDLVSEGDHGISLL